MLKKWRIYIIILAIIAVAIILIFILKSCQGSEPSSDLLGTWSFAGDFLGTGADTRLLLQINEFAPAKEGENAYVGVGCMQTEASGGWAPLSMQATFNPEANSYALNMLSTLVAPELEARAAVVRFVGESKMASARLGDDSASGLSYSTVGEIAWTGQHTSREVVECPAWDDALGFQGEVGNQRDLAYTPPLDTTNFGAETMIVSTEMEVKTPDEQVILVPYHTDIFTPQINFIDSFRYHAGFEGTPITSQPYSFKLLDVLGAPIPGAESRDTYIHCDHGAATHLRALYNLENQLELTWDAPALVPGRFEPENGHGFYQVTLEYHPWKEDGFLYGAEANLTTHKIPWNSFVPGSSGSPDGADYGVSLSELEDGTYIIQVASYNYYEPAEGDAGFDCRVSDSRQALIITKQGNQITFQPAGAVSGFIHDGEGNALAGIAVEINGAGTGFHERVCSMANGFYLFTRLPLDTLSLSAGGFGTEGCDPNNFKTIIQPDFTLTDEDPIRNIDLAITP